MSIDAEAPQLKQPVPTYVWVWLGLSLLAGPVGFTIFCFVCLVRAQPPTSVAGRRLRTVGLAAGWTATVAGTVGGAIGFVLGMDNPRTVAFAVLEVALFGAFPGLLLGAIVGLVLVAADVVRGRRA